MRRIYARECQVRKLSSDEAFAFCQENHRQGGLKSCSERYGLFYHDELVQVETFGFPRIERQNKIVWHDWELYRECSLKDTYVVGGKSKLLKAFEREHHPLALLSYCSLSEGFDGHSYAACGFVLERVSEDYWYELNGKVFSRNRMQKSQTKRAAGIKENIEATLESLGMKYDPCLTETENALNNGFQLKKGKGQQTWSKYFSTDIGFIYMIENRQNGKVYIGKHQLMKNGVLGNTDYFGSGVALKAAVKKYGKKNFRITPLKWYSDLFQMCNDEWEFIDEYSRKYGKKNMYNLDFRRWSATTGLWEYDEEKYKNAAEKRAAHVSATRKRQFREDPSLGKAISERQKEYYSTHDGPFKGRKHTEATLKKISERQKEYYSTHDNPKKGHHLSEETKQKLRDARKRQDMSYMQTPEYKKALSEGLKGRNVSQESIDKMKATMAANKERIRQSLKNEGYILSDERLKGVQYRMVKRIGNVRAYEVDETKAAEIKKSGTTYGKVSMLSPDGKKHYVKKEMASSFISKGWTMGSYKGHHLSKEARKKISETKRKKYENGEYSKKDPWNKGKKDIFNDEQLERIKEGSKNRQQKHKKALEEAGLICVDDKARELGMSRAEVLKRFHCFEHFIGKQKYIVLRIDEPQRQIEASIKKPSHNGEGSIYNDETILFPSQDVFRSSCIEQTDTTD